LISNAVFVFFLLVFMQLSSVATRSTMENPRARCQCGRHRYFLRAAGGPWRSTLDTIAHSCFCFLTTERQEVRRRELAESFAMRKVQSFGSLFRRLRVSSFLSLCTVQAERWRAKAVAKVKIVHLLSQSIPDTCSLLASI
jgi:hypothetical protein